jgi:hypothetical protein
VFEITLIAVFCLWCAVWVIIDNLSLRQNQNRQDFRVFLSKYDCVNKDFHYAKMKLKDADAHRVLYHGFMSAYNEHKSNPLMGGVTEIKNSIEREFNRQMDKEKEHKLDSFLRN